MTEPRTVWLANEYMADVPLWADDDGDTPGPETLSASLVEDLASWSRDWEAAQPSWIADDTHDGDPVLGRIPEPNQAEIVIGRSPASTGGEAVTFAAGSRRSSVWTTS